MVSPSALPVAVHGYEPTQTRGTTDSDNTNLCVEDDTVDLVENNITNMLVLENKGVTSRLQQKHTRVTLPQVGKVIKHLLQMKNQTNQGMISLLTCSLH